MIFSIQRSRGDRPWVHLCKARLARQQRRIMELARRIYNQVVEGSTRSRLVRYVDGTSPRRLLSARAVWFVLSFLSVENIFGGFGDGVDGNYQ